MNRRDFIKLGAVGGTSIMIASLMPAFAEESIPHEKVELLFLMDANPEKQHKLDTGYGRLWKQRKGRTDWSASSPDVVYVKHMRGLKEKGLEEIDKQPVTYTVSRYQNPHGNYTYSIDGVGGHGIMTAEKGEDYRSVRKTLVEHLEWFREVNNGTKI